MTDVASFKPFQIIVVIIVLAFFTSEASAHGSQDSSEWQQGYTLILMSNTDIASANQARDYVISQGGRIAILLPPHAMLGWVPLEGAWTLPGNYGIESIHYGPVNLSQIEYHDQQTLAAVSFFNSVTDGTLAREAAVAAQKEPLPLTGDVLGGAAVNFEDYRKNLEDFGIEPSLANSDSLTGSVAVALFFIESNGAVDPNSYTWSSTDQSNTFNRAMSGLSWWSNKAPSYGKNVSFTPFMYASNNPATQQGYEPVKHPISEDGLWIERIMANLGFSTGDKVARVTAWNTWLRGYANTNWAYSAFIAYNPSPAPGTFGNGQYSAYAYDLGGPYTQLLFRNFGDEQSFGDVLSHETGHIFWACDEYYQAGYGGCTSCSACAPNGPRPNALNGNCQFCNSNVVSCRMHTSSANALCNFTVEQVGWGASSGCGSFTVGQGRSGPELTAFQNAHSKAGGQSVLGCPTDVVKLDGFTSSTGVSSHYQSFANGAIEYHTNGSRAGQAFAVINPLYDKWRLLGFTASNPLGYPIEDLSSQSTSCYGTALKYQTFELGALSHHRNGPYNNQVFETHGPIYTKWGQKGYAACPLGLPISDVKNAPTSGATGGTGLVVDFEGQNDQHRGHIYLKSGAGVAFETHGVIDRVYNQTGGPASWLGYPISDEYVASTGYARNDFEAGYITTTDGVNYQAFSNTRPNLTPYQLAGWSDKIVVSTTTGTNTDSTLLSPTDGLYVDWAEINNGSGATGATFYASVYVDGVERASWYTPPPLNANAYAYVSDYFIGSLSAGQHTIKVVLDTTGSISESNESDNEYTKTITVGGATGGLQYYPLPRPLRLLDTRPGESACYTPGAPLAGGTARTQTATVQCGGLSIPAGARAIVGNAAVVNNGTGASAGYITLYPSGVTRPEASNLNYEPGQILSNAFTVGLGADGAFQIFSYSSLHFVLDVTGYYAPPGTGGLYYHPLPRPVRLLDTRPGEGGCDAPGAPLLGGTARWESARRTCEGIIIPDEARALVGNAAVVNNEPGAGAGYITLYPSGVARPEASNLNYEPGQILSNAFTVGLSSDGAFQIFSYSSLHFVLDVAGYYSSSASPDANGVAGLLYHPLSYPARLLDTRPGELGCYNPGAPLAAMSTRFQPAAGVCGLNTIPSGARAVVGNAAVVNNAPGSGAGYITLYPSGVARPAASNLNYEPGQILSNAFTVGLGTDGAFQIFSYSSLHFVSDISGYFALPPVTRP